MRKHILAGIVGLALVTTACGDDASESSDTVAETTEATVPAPATTVPTPTTTVPAPATTVPGPEADGELRIVSLSPTLTEMMFAIGAGDDLVAIDEYSNYPPEALELPHELSGFEPNVEAIAGYEPDVVLISGDFTGLGGQLEPLDIEVWDGPAAVTLDDTYAQIEGLGELTGNQEEARR